jgi:hypothetical protein
MDNARSDSACLSLTYSMSICEAKELIIYILKSSNRLPISALISPPLDNLCTLKKVASLVADLFLIDPRDHLLQIFTMYS